MTGQRRKARAVALQAMYEIDTTRHEAEEVLGRLLAEENLSGDNTAFVRQMVKQVVEHQAEIDG
ncbi:MAG: transcription antitermination factor NusB, partial [Dehalococcoidia bacterium]|nr:transcription antitermination factor NusB [Dehalococcoidia bacterium]